MVRNFYFSLAFLFILNSALGQENLSIQGILLNAINGNPLPNCSVFINNTSMGTTSDSSGRFNLKHIPLGKYDLIISCIGYETSVVPFTNIQLPLDLRISLKHKVTELSAVTIEPFLRDGWAKWGRFFLNNFIGRTSNADQCKILNRKILRFFYSSKHKRLTVLANEPLIIENKALGYLISYQLEEFTAELQENQIIYLGYPHFTEMNTDRKKVKRKWEANRQLAYLGCMTHFMRCLYRNELSEAGFQVRKLIKTRNTEKLRVKALLHLEDFQQDSLLELSKGILKNLNRENQGADSAAYYYSILKQTDIQTVYSTPLGANDLLSIDSSKNEILFFKDTLYVFYINNKIGPPRSSAIHLISPIPVQVDINGSYFPPQEVFLFGYWAISERIDNLMPLDYDFPLGTN